jgi:hypothetical protein|tara:strand:+ start:20 stop:127 length:108 start_codon:yes stop_codon:yes gene_type:complete
MLGDIIGYILLGSFVGFCLTAVALIIYDEKHWRDK